jgi:hypothetical protein
MLDMALSKPFFYLGRQDIIGNFKHSKLLSSRLETI